MKIVAETISLCSGEVNAMIKGLVYIRNRNKLKQLFLNLQQTVDKSTKVLKYLNYQIFSLNLFCRRARRS